MISRNVLACVALLFPLVLSGCSEGASGSTARQKTYKVTGKVTMNGAPVANAFVTFSPTASTPAATGRTDTEGKYTVTTYDAGDGAVAGDYTVLVFKEGAPAPTGPVAHDPKSPVSGSAIHAARNAAGPSGLLPTKYSSATTSDLKVTVKAEGPNDFPLDLKP